MDVLFNGVGVPPGRYSVFWKNEANMNTKSPGVSCLCPGSKGIFYLFSMGSSIQFSSQLSFHAK